MRQSGKNLIFSRSHLLLDLKPYACVIQGCPDPDRTYGIREDWDEHVKFAHGKDWRCCFGCPDSFSSAEGFDSHLRAEHGAVFAEAELPTLRDMCEKHILPADHSKCPLCFSGPLVWSDQDERQQHIATHLEEIALQILRPGAFQVQGAASILSSSAAQGPGVGQRGGTNEPLATSKRDTTTSASAFTGWVSSQPPLSQKIVSQPYKLRASDRRSQPAQDSKDKQADSLADRRLSRRSSLLEARKSEEVEAHKRVQHHQPSEHPSTISKAQQKLAPFDWTYGADASRETRYSQDFGGDDIWASYLERASSDSEAEKGNRRMSARMHRPGRR